MTRTTHRDLADLLGIAQPSLAARLVRMGEVGSQRRMFSDEDVARIVEDDRLRRPHDGEMTRGAAIRALGVAPNTFDRYCTAAQVTPRRYASLAFYSAEMIEQIRAAQAGVVPRTNATGRKPRKKRAVNAPVPTAAPVPSDEEERIRRAVRLIGDGWKISLIKSALGFSEHVIVMATQRLQGVLF